MLDHRVAIEVGSAILAAERADREDLDALDAWVERMAADTEFDAYRRADIRFHIGLAEPRPTRPYLVTEMTEVQAQMSDLIALIAHPEEVLTRSNAQHRKLVAHLREGDADAAAKLIRHHVQGTEHILTGLV